MTPTTIPQNQMPEAQALIAYEDGSVMAAMFHYVAESVDYREVAEENGFHCLVAPLLDDALISRYEDGENIMSEWRPTPPAGWMLGGVWDTEDGPHAIFLRSAEDASEAAE